MISGVECKLIDVKEGGVERKVVCLYFFFLKLGVLNELDW